MGILRSPKRLITNALSNRHTLLVLCSAFGLCAALPQHAKADFVGDYAFSNTLSTSNMYGNWTLFNTDQVCTLSGCVPGQPSGTNGSASTPDNGASVVLTTNPSGSGAFGETDLTITAAMSGVVQFDWSYSSTDPSQYAATIPNVGCGLNNAGPCDQAGYILNGVDYQIADDQNQGMGLVTFAVTAGESFGFYVQTDDNNGGQGMLTLSQFSAPDPSTVPEPSSRIVLFGLIAAILIGRRWIDRGTDRQGVQG